MNFSPAKPSDTPRTNHESYVASDWVPTTQVVPSGFSRELERELNATLTALEACVEDSIELLGERGWWKDEPRAGFSQRYAETQENILRARTVLDRAFRAGEAGVNSQTTTNQTNP